MICPLELVLEPDKPLDAALQVMLDEGVLIWQGARVPKAKTPSLLCGMEGAALCIPPFKPVLAELGKAYWQRRRQEGKQGIVRAVKPKAGQLIWDLTAGWGRDAAIMASFGASVVMFEQHPIMAYVLQDALSRAERAGNALPLTLVHTDALAYLENITEQNAPRADVIYIDPMHPARQKSALVKKDLQLLQALLPPSDDVASLIKAACAVAKERVILKWPVNQPVPIATASKVPGQTVHYYLFEP